MAEKHRQQKKKRDMKRKGEGQGACLQHEKQKEKERSYGEDVRLWQGHWVRPHWTKFVRHFYLCDYKIKYISLPTFENNPFQYLERSLNTEISCCTHTTKGFSCGALSQYLKQNFKGSPINIFVDLLFLHLYQCVFYPAASQLQKVNLSVLCIFLIRLLLMFLESLNQTSQQKTSLKTQHKQNPCCFSQYSMY